MLILKIVLSFFIDPLFIFIYLLLLSIIKLHFIKCINVCFQAF